MFFSCKYPAITVTFKKRIESIRAACWVAHGGLSWSQGWMYLWILPVFPISTWGFLHVCQLDGWLDGCFKCNMFFKM